MKGKSKAWIGISILCFLVLTFLYPNPLNAQSIHQNTLDQQLDDYIDQTLSSLNIPAASIVVSSGGNIIYHHSSGEDVTDHSRFFIGSITKSFTGLAIAQLVDEGMIDLNQSVSYYIPQFKVSDQITVKHLLHHMSGMEESEYNSFGALEPDSSFLDLVHDMNGMGLSHTPGTTFAYFNPNYSLLGLIIENVSGLSYNDYMQTRIFEPLGLTNVSLKGEVDVDGHLSFFGFPIRRPEPFVNYDLPGGFMSASSNDLIQFLDAIHLRDARLGLSEKGFDTFLNVNSINGFYSMGLMHYPLGNRPAIHHGGSLPGFSANGIILPEDDITIALLLNKNHMLLATMFQPDLTDGIIHILTNQESSTRLGLYWLYRAFVLMVLFVIGVNVRKFIDMLQNPEKCSVNQRIRSILINGGIIVGSVIAIPWLGSIMFPQRGFDLGLVFLLMPDFIVLLFIGLSMHMVTIIIHGWIMIMHHRHRNSI